MTTSNFDTGNHDHTKLGQRGFSTNQLSEDELDDSHNKLSYNDILPNYPIKTKKTCMHASFYILCNG